MKILTLALAVFIAGAALQKAQAQDLSYWVRVTPPDEQFAVMMPQMPTNKTQKDSYGRMEVDGQSFTVTENGTVYTLWSLNNRAYKSVQQVSVEDYLDDCADLVWESLLKPRREMFEPERMGGMTYRRELKAGGIPGREYFVRIGPKQGVARFFVDEEKIYVLVVYNAQVDDARAVRFLSSFEPDREKAGSQSSQADNAGNGDRPLSLVLGPGKGSNVPGGDDAQTGSAGATDYDKVFTPRETTEKARIIARPEPQYTESARKYHVSGTVVLEAVLAKTGEVSDVRVVRSLPHGLTRMSIEAVKRIRFIPATKDGIAVSQRIIVEYNYNLY